MFTHPCIAPIGYFATVSLAVASALAQANEPAAGERQIALLSFKGMCLAPAVEQQHEITRLNLQVPKGTSTT